MKEAEILQYAVERLEILTRSDAAIKAGRQVSEHRWDTMLHVKAGAAAGEFNVLVKGNVLPANLIQMMEKLEEGRGLLVAKYISGPAKALLESKGINYLDMAGNCYIRNDKGIFWLIRGQSLPDEARGIKHEAFHKNGIKLLYILLLRKDWVNEPYRFLADKACIAASTVGDILNDLKASEFLWQINEQQVALASRPELLAQWATSFNKRLKPKLSRGKFRFAKSTAFQDWKNLNLGPNTFWGGEPAADLLTHYLQPGIWTIYTNLDRKALLKDLQLAPDPKQGNVEVYSIFWNEKEESFIHPALKTVSPLLAYADLIGSGDSRNLEAAKRIYEQYLKDIFEQGNR